MKFGIDLWLDDSIETVLKLSQIAEQTGFDYLWFPDHYFLRDSYVVQALVCNLTRKAKIGTSVVSPYLRHPVAIASAAASLNELSGGRIVLGIGAGGHEFHSQLLLEMKYPRTGCADAIEIIKGVWSGSPFTYHGKEFSVENAALSYKPISSIPIYLAARGPKMLELALSVGNGIITHGTTDKYVSFVKSRITAVNSTSFDFAISAPACVSSDRRAAIKALAPECLLLAGGHYYDGWIGMYDLELRQVESLREAVRLNDPKAASLVTQQMVDAFSVYGTEDEVIERLRHMEKLGVSHVSISVPRNLVEHDKVQDASEMIRRFAPVIRNLAN